MTRHRIAFVLVSCFIFAFATNVSAQCGCTFTIPPTPGLVTFDGVVKGVKPGDKICLGAGTTSNIVFRNITGTPNAPVVITNCTGVATVGGLIAPHAISFTASKYVRVTGSGDPTIQYGIVIGTSNTGLMYYGLSSDVEIDHVDVSAPFVGMMIKTDPSSNCADVAAVRPNFTLRNVSVHDNYIHDTGAEGIYIGNSFYTGTSVYCGQTQYPHEVRGLRVYQNRIENTGLEGIQIGSAVQDVDVHHNTLLGCGAMNNPSQNYSVLLGQGTTGAFHNNTVISAHGATLTVGGIGNQLIYDNIFAGESGGSNTSLLINMRPTPLATDIVPNGFLGGIQIINNTFVSQNNESVIHEVMNSAPNNVLINNLVVTPVTPWERLMPTSQWTKATNLVYTNLTEPRFVNGPGGDYHLTNASPAISAGSDMSKWGITSDFDGRPVQGPRPCVGAFQFGPKPPTGVQVK